jgi:hypothetical protein
MIEAAPGGPRAGRESLNVEADLTISLSGSAARLTGSGQRLVLHLDSPWDAFASVPDGSSLRTVNAVAQGLDRAGLRVDVVSDQGTLVSMGAGVRTGKGRARPLAFGSPTALLALARPGVIRVVARHRSAAGVALAAAVTTVAAWALRRRAGRAG